LQISNRDGDKEEKLWTAALDNKLKNVLFITQTYGMAARLGTWTYEPLLMLLLPF